MEKISRRDFLLRAAVMGAGVAAAVSIPSIVEAAVKQPKKIKRISLKKDAVILFQGDSITDNGRDRKDMNYNSPKAMGYGYAAHTAGGILLDQAAYTPRIYNRGISGNKVFQLRDRWEKDCFELQPDVLSILIGVNDFWHAFDGKYDGTPAVYRRDYLELVDRTMNRFPDLQLVICEPYAVNNVKAVTDAWFPSFLEIRAAAKEVADTYGAIFVPFQKVFDEAAKKAPASYWTHDGVHSSLAGSQLMAAAWLKATGL